VQRARATPPLAAARETQEVAANESGHTTRRLWPTRMTAMRKMYAALVKQGVICYHYVMWTRGESVSDRGLDERIPARTAGAAP